MNFISVCSGIEAMSEAGREDGFKAVALAEIEPFPCWVLTAREGASRPWHMPNPNDAPDPMEPGLDAKEVERREKEIKRRTLAIKAVADLPDDGLPNIGDFPRLRDYPDLLAQAELLAGGTPCFSGDTLIVTRRGLTPISDVEVGDEVLTHRHRWRKVLATGSKVSETIRLKGQGQSHGIVTTREHPFYARQKVREWIGGSWRSRLTESEWCEAKDMVGSMWAIPASWPTAEPPPISVVGNERQPPNVDAEMAWVIGRWLGDGWCRVNQRRGYVMICGAFSEADEIAQGLRAAGLRFSMAKGRNSARFQIASRALARWLTAEFGAGANGKTMPTWVLGWKHRRALLDGYLSADGHDVPGGRRATSISAKLALGVMLLGASLGYAVGRHLVKPQRSRPLEIEGRPVNENPFWQVTLYGSPRSSMESDGHRWARVKTLESAPPCAVFNLEVEGDNSYVADGFVVHNCQDFSVAGLRAGLSGARGNLTLEFVRLFDAIDTERSLRGLPPAICLWENVPGIFSDKSNAFGCFLAGLVGADAPIRLGRGQRWTDAGLVVGPKRRAAWRTPDAQFFGLAQRRRRVLVVASAREGFDPSAVLLEPEGVRRHSPPRRGEGERPAASLTASSGGVSHKDDPAGRVAGTIAGGGRPHWSQHERSTRWLWNWR